jgi:hypothetical protein
MYFLLDSYAARVLAALVLYLGLGPRLRGNFFFGFFFLGLINRRRQPRQRTL